MIKSEMLDFSFEASTIWLLWILVKYITIYIELYQ